MAVNWSIKRCDVCGAAADTVIRTTMLDKTGQKEVVEVCQDCLAILMPERLPEARTPGPGQMSLF